MKKVYVGVDVGTDSAGIACTDENYKLLRAKGKDLWAVRLFDEANTAVDRRTKRTMRRRLQRRAWRIKLLREIFLPQMEDKKFFLRLDNSGFAYEDKDLALQSPCSLFSDKSFSDKHFYKSFPTIYHLRKALIEGKEKYDLRLYYLAVHHILKYRGHFLYESENVSEVRNLENLFDGLNNVAEAVFCEEIPMFSKELSNAFRDILLAPRKGIKDKSRELSVLFDAKTPQSKEILNMLAGGKGKPWIIFDNEDYKNEKSFAFGDVSDEDFDAKIEVFGDDFEYLAKMKEIYNFILFERVLNGKEYISESMIEIYDKHRKDLNKLKKIIINELSHDEYVRMFKSTTEKSNYVNYIGSTKEGKIKLKVKKCKTDEFYKYVKRFIETIPDSTEKLSILSDIGDNNFMPKILNADNGLFPHQINGAELSAVLKNLVRDYPQFGLKDESGYCLSEKIEKLFRFRIPYYVGPLNTYHSDKGGNSWAVRKTNERITPWNFDNVIDKAASNEKFMSRMTNNCSYLYGEPVLPRCSIIFQAYNTLNQLNKLKIDEQPISVELKQNIFKDLFLKRQKVTVRDIKKYLVDNGLVEAKNESQTVIGGSDVEFKASMSSYVLLKGILGDFVDEHLDVCENIIKWHTLNTDKRIVEKLIKDNYKQYSVVESNIKRLVALSFKDFATLSKKFLWELSGGINPVTGEIYTVLGELYNTNYNLNQLLYEKKYCFLDNIRRENGEEKEVSYETLEEMRLSPAVRRGVWQTIKMIDEYVSAIGRVPDKIFVEVTRSEDLKKERTKSRKEQLLAFYKDAKDITELVNLLNKKTDFDLRSERLYLYFKQLGKCAYSGDEISLEYLGTDLYDVDHILPRSITKDDSLENKVLVRRELNAKKSDTYPVPNEFRQDVLWKQLNDMGLMSRKKYALLTRTKPLCDDDLRDFVARQIGFTGQSAKAVAELLRRKYEETGTKVVYSKAKNIDDFKNRYGIVKCRDTNDLHHARDAYLNIVVGNVYDTKFSSVWDYFYKKPDDTWREYNLQKLFDRSIEGAWDKDTSLISVKKVLGKPSISVTRYTHIGKGAFYDETIFNKNETGISAPRKASAPYNQTEKYGGYKSMKTAYFCVVQSLDKKGKTEKRIEAIPVYIDYLAKTKHDAVMCYLTDTLALKQPQVLVNKIKIGSLLEIKGTPVWLTGVEGNALKLQNAVQWFTDANTDSYVKALIKLRKMKSNGKLTDEELAKEEYPVNTNRFKAEKLIVNKANNAELYEEIINQLSKRIYSGVSGFSTFRKKLGQCREKFDSLSCINQMEVLTQCLRFMKCNAELADLTLLDEKKNSGKLSVTKSITDADIVIVHTSVCGLTEYRRKL